MRTTKTMMMLFFISSKVFMKHTVIDTTKQPLIHIDFGTKDVTIDDNFYIKSGGYETITDRDTLYSHLLNILLEKYKIKKDKIKSIKDLEAFGLI
jgi:hypothetical protein